MTAGRVLVPGDPGPWICGGMTGGVLYIRLNPRMGLTIAAIRRWMAQGANVAVQPVAVEDGAKLRELIHAYAAEVARDHQHKEAERTRALLDNWEQQFVKIALHRAEWGSGELMME